MPEQANSYHRIAVPIPDNGTEVLWGQRLAAGAYELASVPVFAYGISRGTVVNVIDEAAQPLEFAGVSRIAVSATMRCYVSFGLKASEVYKETMMDDGNSFHLRLGPATFLDPEIVAVNVPDRSDVGIVGRYFDSLVSRGYIRFWELGDPDLQAPPSNSDYIPEAWVLEHERPDGKAGATMAHY